jgi:hypothetical protein
MTNDELRALLVDAYDVIAGCLDTYASVMSPQMNAELDATSLRITAALAEKDGYGWIAVGKRLPTERDADINGNVLVCRDRKRIGINQWECVKAGFGDDLWQPLPPLPTERKV